MTVSFIIVNYNTSDLLAECLQSIYEKTKDVIFEIIVIDNASSDSSCGMVKSRFPGVRLIQSDVNLGFGRANNLAVKSAKGDFLFFLNSDTQLINNAVLILVQFMQAHPECGIAGGNLTDLSEHPVHSYSMLLPSWYSDFFRFYRRSLTVILGHSNEYNYSGKVKQVGYITGADLMIRKSLFDSLGGFDPIFFMYYEEAELTYRLWKSGYTVWSVPAAKILHVKGASLEFLTSARKVVFESKYRYIAKVCGLAHARLAHWIFSFYIMYKKVVCAMLLHQNAYRRYKKIGLIAKIAYKQEIIQRT